jgi:Zn-dependent M28 family amino/carboxypeptidase
MRTAVWLVSFGCEEFGIHGSKHFIDRHIDEIKDAYVLNLDMVGEKGAKLHVVTKEKGNFIRLSEAMVNQVKDAAYRIHVPLKARPVMFYTDAMAFALKGFTATSLIALDDKGVSKTHHSLQDTPANVDYALVLDSYRICVEFIENMDATESKRTNEKGKA